MQADLGCYYLSLATEMQKSIALMVITNKNGLTDFDNDCFETIVVHFVEWDIFTRQLLNYRLDAPDFMIVHKYSNHLVSSRAIMKVQPHTF